MTAVDKGILSAHEAKSVFRHRMILDELAAIQKNLAFLAVPHKLNVQEILEFEEKYRDQVANRHGYIIPPHFDAAKKLSIDELYVCPNFEKTPSKKDEESKVLEMLDFISVLYRAVVLGDPGGGKSTFAFKLCHDLATRYSERLFAGRQVTPILVVLRDYGAEKKVRNCSILQFIEATANSKYQVQPPRGAFEYLLLSGRAIVIFDGLDELLETSYRQEISSDVESFCTLYPSVPVLVTSRKVGYEQAPLDKKKFETFRLTPFNNDQVHDYVIKWFATDTDLTPDHQKHKANAFLEESRIVPDLRSNPLMLALLCNIYRGENYIPQNRPDVYEKCALMLFERWDKSRGIHVTLPIEAHIKPAMMYLACWIYTNETLQGGVTEKSLIAKATEYLCPKRFENRDEAEKAAFEFIEFCRGRAWVFTDTGTMKEGERLYQFAHRTFLEYFTAAHLVRTHPTPDRLLEILLSKIAKREWDLVAQLAFQLQNKNVEGAGDELLSVLLKRARESESHEGWNLLSFATRCLEFMVPSPRITREITSACIEHSLAWSLKRNSGKALSQSEYQKEISPKELLRDLIDTATENRITVADSLEKFLVERINNGNETEALLALQIGLNLELPLHFRGVSVNLKKEVFDFWRNVSNRIFDMGSNRIAALCPKYFWICFESFWRDTVSMANLVKWHGIESLFQSTYNELLEVETISLASMLLDVAFIRYSSDEKIYLENQLRHLEEVSPILLSSPTPWMADEKVELLLRGLDLDRDSFARVNPADYLKLSSDALFGAFVLFAVVLEVSSKKAQKKYLDLIRKPGLPFFNSIHCIFLSRFMHIKQMEHTVQAEMDNCGFTAEQQAFAWRWIRKEINLVQRIPHNDEKNREDLSEQEEP